MEFREISTFLQVAKFKSFSRAAEQLGYTQAAVTIQIKNLENELGVHLFDRIGKQTLLTHQGRIFYNYASNITREISQAKDALSNPSVFPVLLREYHRRYPKVNIKIVTDSPEILLHMMDKNTLDIVYFLDKPVYNTKWVKVLEKPEEVFFVSSSENPLSKRRELNLDEVICQPFISTEKDASYRLLLEESLAEKGYELHPFLETGNTEFIINQLRHNLGVSFLPGFIVKKDLDEGRLSRLDVRDFHLQVCRQIVYHKDKWVTREMKAFLELAQDFL